MSLGSRCVLKLRASHNGALQNRAGYFTCTPKSYQIVISDVMTSHPISDTRVSPKNIVKCRHRSSLLISYKLIMRAFFLHLATILTILS